MLSMRLSRLLPLSVFASALLFTPAAMPQTAATAVRIVNPIDESQRVTLKGTVHPLANARNDRGAAPDSLQVGRMHLVLTRSASQESALQQLIGEMHTPGSPNYHKWLTPDQFGQQFGPSDQDIATVKTWLTGHGFNVTMVNPGKQTLEFTGNAAQVRSAFHTQIHKYEVNGETHFANANDPQIPAALAQVVGGFVSLNNFKVNSYAKVLGKATYDPRTDKATPEWTWGTTTSRVNFVLAPQDYDVQYDLTPLYSAGTTGSGQTIAIVNESNINIDLVNQFRTLFSLPVNPPQVIIDGNDPGVDGIDNPDGPNYASVEAYLDVEWSGAVAPNATIDLVIAGDTSLESGLYLAAERAVYGNIAPVVSLSFGACESALSTTNTFLNALWEQAAAQGITVTVSTGDAGSAGCDNDNSQYYATGGQAVNGFASTPFDVAVGGTDFYYSFYQNPTLTDFATYWNTSPTQQPAVSIKGVIPEQPWNNSQFGLDAYNELTSSGNTTTSIAGGGGGASSTYTTKPSWQQGTGVPADGVRDLPDVSLFAANGDNYSFYPICASDGDCQNPSSGNVVQITGVGGTSAAAPSFAGIMALVNQKNGRQGQADFVLYPLAKQFPTAFHDVTVGTNSVPCQFSTTTSSTPSPNCIAVAGGPTITDPTLGAAVEGQIGKGTTPEYNATVGYDLASGLGTIDANQLVTNWGNVKFTSTTTTLTPSQTTFTHGTSITVSGSVTPGTASGAVALMTDSNEPGQQGQGLPGLVANNVSTGTFALSGGNFNGSTSTLPGGTYNIWGQYGGDGTNGMSSSTPVSITVNPENSALAFTIYASVGAAYTATAPPTASVDYGTQMKLNAKVSPSSAATTYTPPSGTVTFKDGSTVINTASINAEGDAEYSAPFAIGSHSVTASYGGDASYNAPAGSAAIPFTVAKDTPVLQLFADSILTSSNQAENSAGQPTIITVTIENGIQNSASNAVTPPVMYPVSIAAPTGTVTVSGLPAGNGTFQLSPGVDASDGAAWGVANVTIPAGTASGTYPMVVTYNGDGNYNGLPATSTSIPIVGGGLVASTTAATVSGSISPTATITVTGTVTGQSGHPAPTGSVYIYASAFYITSARLSSSSGITSNFSVTLNSSNLIQGANLINVQYSGDTVYNPSAMTLNGGAPISNPLSDFTLISDSGIVPVTPGGSGSTTVNLASMNGFSGAVGLTCTAATGITCSLSTSSDTLSSGGIGSAAVTINVPSGTAAGNYNVLITGTSGSFVHTLGVTAEVSGAASTTPSFLLSNSGSITLKPGATTGNTSTISATPTNGFTGTVTLQCNVTPPTGATTPITCNVPASVAITGTAAATGTLTIGSTSATTGGAYVVTVTGKSGTITQTTTVDVTVNSTTGGFALSSNPATLSLTGGATTGNTSTITVTPSGGFAGAVTLQCNVTPPGGATSPINCNIPTSVTISGTTAATATLTIGSTSTTTAGAYTVTVTGKSGTITPSPTTTVSVTITAPVVGTYKLTNSGDIVVSPGAATGNTSTISVTGSGGFSGAVGLTCAIAPTAASDPATCSLSPASVTITGASSGTSTLTVSTTAAIALNRTKSLFWPSTGGAALALVLFFGIPKRRRNWLAMLGLLVLFVSLGAMGCNSSKASTGGGGGGGNTGTTAGTYTVTVTGTAGSTTETTTVALTVN